MRLALLLGLVYALSIKVFGENKPITFSDSDKKLLISDRIHFFKFPKNSQIGLDTLLTSEERDQPSSPVPNFSFTDMEVWGFFTIKNESEDRTLTLEIDYPFIDQVEFYEVKNNRLVLLERSGNQFPYQARKVKTPIFSMDFELAPHQATSFVLKTSSKDLLMLPILVSSKNTMSESMWLKNLVIGICFGILIVMFIYNFLIYLFIRDTSYLFYISYIFFIALTQASLLGYSYQYLWPNWPEFNSNSILIFSCLTGIFAILFVRNYLQTSSLLPRLDKVFVFGVVIYCAGFVPIALNDKPLAYRFVDIGGLYSSILALTISIILSIKGYRSAKFFFVAWSTFLCSITVFVLRNLGVLPFNTFSNYSILFGASLEATLLSIALADKINILKREKEESQQQAIKALQENERLIVNQNIMLEQKVTQRTYELETAYKDLQNTQTQLVSSEKMASLGQLTAGIAHEINNPINFVVSSIAPLKRDIADMKELLDKYEEITLQTSLEPKLVEIHKLRKEMDIDFVKEEIEMLLKGINDGAVRTAEIVKSLKTFSRVDESDLKRADLNEGLASTIVLLTQQWSGKIDLIKNFGPISHIECYPGKLNQVFMNILNNAIQAILAHPKPNEKGRIEVQTFEEADNIVISIKDNGMGMSAETKKKIFDPFFTTKEVGKGTGLGLSITYSIIEKHGGTIDVVSELGQGAEFIIRLPIVDEFVIKSAEISPKG